MRKISEIKKCAVHFYRRDIIALASILLASLAVFSWVASAFLPQADNQFRREIVNDDYDSLTAPLMTGDVITQSIVVEGKLYGVRLNVHTGNVILSGRLALDVLDENDARLTGCITDMSVLLNDTFHLFVFDNMIVAENKRQYTLRLSVLESDGPIALHKSSSATADYHLGGKGEIPTEDSPHYSLNDFWLTENGKTQDGTLALQYIIRYAKGFIYTAFWIFALMLTAFSIGLYMLIFVFNVALHRVFITCALVLGLVLLFLIPPRTAPDEYVHIATAYQYSNNLLGWGNEPLLTMRAGDEMYLAKYDFDATNVFAWQDLYEGLLAIDPGGGTVQVAARTTDSFFLMHAAPTLGVFLARILGLGVVPLLLFGRLANLIFYTLLVSRAIKRIPFAKPLLFGVALLPSSLQLAASFSYDTYVIALAFYLLAACLELTMVEKQASWIQLLKVGVCAVLLAPGKAVYVLLLGLLLFIPLAAYKNKKARWVFFGATVLCALTLWAVGNWVQISNNLKIVLGNYRVTTVKKNETRETIWLVFDDGEMQTRMNQEQVATSHPEVENTELFSSTDEDEIKPLTTAPVESNNWSHSRESYSPLFIIQNLPKTLKLLAASFWQHSPMWLQGLLGGQLGEAIAINLSTNWLFTIGLLLALIILLLPSDDAENTYVLAKKQRLGLAGIGTGVAIILLGICIMWTPIDYETIFGFQGRYLLPVLPLVLLAMRGHSLQWKRPAWRVGAFAVPTLGIFICLDVFVQIIGRAGT